MMTRDPTHGVRLASGAGNHFTMLAEGWVFNCFIIPTIKRRTIFTNIVPCFCENMTILSCFMMSFKFTTFFKMWEVVHSHTIYTRGIVWIISCKEFRHFNLLTLTPKFGERMVNCTVTVYRRQIVYDFKKEKVDIF
jgi:hypothetical protein